MRPSYLSLILPVSLIASAANASDGFNEANCRAIGQAVDQYRSYLKKEAAYGVGLGFVEAAGAVFALEVPPAALALAVSGFITGDLSNRKAAEALDPRKVSSELQLKLAPYIRSIPSAV